MASGLTPAEKTRSLIHRKVFPSLKELSARLQAIEGAVRDIRVRLQILELEVYGKDANDGN